MGCDGGVREVGSGIGIDEEGPEDGLLGIVKWFVWARILGSTFVEGEETEEVSPVERCSEVEYGK